MPHCYDTDGTPHFDLTPRKAKELGYLFSVTEIQRIESAPGLEIWKQNQMIEEAFRSPAEDGEDMDSFKKRIKESLYGDNSASDLGTRIHDAIEQILGNDRDLEDIPEDLVDYVEPAVTYFREKGHVARHIEKIVVNIEDGYAGMVDVIGETAKGKPFIMDWKSTKSMPALGPRSKAFKQGYAYANHLEQISAYAVAHFGRDAVMDGEVWGCNAYICTDPGNKKNKQTFATCSYKPELMAQAYHNFDLCNQLWRLRNNYDPRS